MMPLSHRMEGLAPNYYANLGEKVAAIQAGGGDVIRLDIGSPDLPPAGHIVAALAGSAAKADSHGYQPHQGTLPLRRAWAEMYRRVHQVPLDPGSEVLPLLGSKEGIFHLTLALVDPGQLVLTPDPGYPTYAQAARFAGAEAYPMPLLAECGYLPDLEAIPLETLRKARLLWLNYPNNPTGATAPAEFFQKAVAFARRHGLLLCHDAAYAQVTYDGYQAPSLLSVEGAKDLAVEFNTLSKSHHMAGWRVGAALGNPEALQALLALKRNADSGHFLAVMEAAVSAMSADQSWLLARNRILQARRDAVVAALHELGLEAALPQAGLYVWCPVPGRWAATDFALALLEEAHVSLTPGTVFGPGGEGYVRLALTAPIERLNQAMARLERWLAEEKNPEEMN